MGVSSYRPLPTVGGAAEPLPNMDFEFCRAMIDGDGDADVSG